VKPTSAAFFRLLFFGLVFIAIKITGFLSARLLVCHVCFDEFVPTAYFRVRGNEPIYVFNLVLLKDFFEVEGFKVACGLDYGAFFNEEVAVVGCCDAFGAYFIVYAFLPQAFPLHAEFFNHFFLVQSHY
jgi:hypothetical protein